MKLLQFFANHMIGANCATHSPMRCAEVNELMTCNPWSRAALASRDLNLAEPQRRYRDAYDNNSSYDDSLGPTPTVHFMSLSRVLTKGVNHHPHNDQ